MGAVFSSGEAASVLVRKNRKVMLSFYHAPMPNLTLLGEFSQFGDIGTARMTTSFNDSNNVNVGVFVRLRTAEPFSLGRYSAPVFCNANAGPCP